MSIIRTRKRGNTYSYSFEAGKTLLGRRKVVEKGGFKTEKEAMTAGMDAYISWQHGDIGITSERITLGEFIEEFLEARKDEFRGSTVGVYRGIARNHVNPILGRYPVQDITPLMVNQVDTASGRKGTFQEHDRSCKEVPAFGDAVRRIPGAAYLGQPRHKNQTPEKRTRQCETA